jgi:PadR family transcriptional regulator, regulatory protein PadR
MNQLYIDNWTSQVKKGTLAFMVFKILKDKEFYGYELIEQIKNKTNIEISEGTLYPLLNRLKKEDLVTSKWVEQPSGIPRKYYVLNQNGIETLIEMEKHWNELQIIIKKI